MIFKTMFKVFSVVGVVSAWADKALEDGEVSVKEAAELIMEICHIFNITALVDLSKYLDEKGGEEDET